VSAAVIGRIVAEAVLAIARRVASPVAAGPSDIIEPMSGLSRSDVEHVAHLARLGLTEGELGLLEGQLNHIVDQYTKLAELDTEAIPPTAQTIELENILREDVVRPSLPVDEVLRNAAEAAGGYVVSPPILGGD
jgi:aspartyl-tRNA(Asn)/glutamyl-tRNA(Gln) amidotransferase subunit C